MFSYVVSQNMFLEDQLIEAKIDDTLHIFLTHMQSRPQAFTGVLEKIEATHKVTANVMKNADTAAN